MKFAARTYIIGAVPFCMGMVFIVANYVYLFNTVVRHRYQSLIPLFGGFLAMLGMLLTCDMRFVKLCWLPLVPDSGCLSCFGWRFDNLHASLCHRVEEDGSDSSSEGRCVKEDGKRRLS